MSLSKKRCIPCEGGIPKLGPQELAPLLPQVPAWRIEGDRLGRTFVLSDFKEAMAFLQRVADVAEAEGHHPDFCLHWSKVEMSLWTHAVGGLTENDFILAAKVDEVFAGMQRTSGEE